MFITKYGLIFLAISIGANFIGKNVIRTSIAVTIIAVGTIAVGTIAGIDIKFSLTLFTLVRYIGLEHKRIIAEDQKTHVKYVILYALPFAFFLL